MSRYLVTGGAGFIGSHIVEELLSRGASVRVLDNLSTGRRENLAGMDVDLIEDDIREAAACARACEGVDAVFHEAAFVSVPASIEDPIACHEVNVTGSINVFRAAAAAGCRRVVYASSCAVYGDAEKTQLGESDAGRMLSPYAASKMASEIYARVFPVCWGLTTVGLRYFNVFGPRQDPKSPYAAVIPLFASAYAEGGRPTIFGDGEQTRDFVYVKNVVSANLLAGEAPLSDAVVFNVGTGVGTSVNQLAEGVRRLMGAAQGAIHGPERFGDIRHSRADIGAIRASLGYEVLTSLEDGLERTVSWYRETAA